MLFGCVNFNEFDREAHAGQLNLEDWNPSENLVNLRGDWDFCWDEFIDPEAPESTWNELCTQQYAPQYWKFYSLPDKKLTNIGRATYRLKILLPDQEIQYGVVYTEIMSSFKLFVDGKLVGQVGIPGDSFDNSIPGLNPNAVFLGDKSVLITIVIHVSNYQHENHGLWQSVYFGNWDNISKFYTLQKMKEIAVFAALGFIGLFYLTVYLIKKVSKDFLYFGIFVIGMATRQLTLENHTLLLLFPGLGFDNYIRLLYAIIFTNGIFMVLFLRSVYPAEFGKVFTSICISIFFIFYLSLPLPVVIFTHYAPIIFVFLIVIPFFFIPLLFKAYRNERQGSGTMLIAYIILNITVIIDVMFVMGFSSWGFKSYIGLLLFVLLQAYVLSIRFSDAIKQAERLEEVSRRSIVLEQAANEADQANKAKSQFLATMSHEIRTPMNGILGITELLQGSSLSQKQKEMVDLIQASGESLLTILNDILDYSKMEAGKIELVIKTFNWRSLKNQIFSIYKYQADKKGLYLNLIEEGEDFEWGFSDSVRIRQVISNVLSNAVKFTEKGGINLYINHVYEAQNVFKIRCKIQDTGMGVPQDKEKYLFEKFTQLDSSITRKYGGTGLGLAITKRLLELMNGKIWLNKEYKNGAEFEFEFPLEKVEEARIREIYSEGTDELLDQKKNINVLIAEDDPTNQYLIENILKKLHVKYDIVSNGMEAVEYSSKKHYDLIFMDINMPIMDGIQASEKILKDSNIIVKPLIVAVTADAFQEDREKCKQAGMKEFLPKPYQRRQIEEIIFNLQTQNT